jgi:hypothetical protein
MQQGGEHIVKGQGSRQDCAQLIGVHALAGEPEAISFSQARGSSGARRVPQQALALVCVWLYLRFQACIPQDAGLARLVIVGARE